MIRHCSFSSILDLTGKRRVNPAGAKRTRADENHPTYDPAGGGLVIGSCAVGQLPDMCYGKSAEWPGPLDDVLSTVADEVGGRLPPLKFT